MKRHIIILGALAFAMCGLQSCLDFDNPGDEKGANEVELDKESFHGASDKIDYLKCASTPESFKSAAETLKNYLGQSKSGQYSLRGGKEGHLPAAHAYQRQFCLGPDNYAQYAVVPHKDFMYGTLTSTYNNSKDFNGDPHYTYTAVKNSLVPLLNHPAVDSIPEIKAINLLYLSIAAQERADLSGPFTFFEDKQNLESPEDYNDVRSIYYNIHENLDSIVDCLKYFENRPDWYKQQVQNLLATYNETTRDLVSATGPTGVRTYILLANSLKLRMAMNIVKVEPETAKQWAEAAVKSGVLEELEDQQGLYPLISGFSHPLCDVSEGWGDTRISASLESLVMSLNHPFKDHLFKKNGAAITNTQTKEVLEKDSRICGIRAGLLMTDGQSFPPNQRIAYSRIDKEAFAFSPLYLIKLAEVDFLRAEGALRGWDMGGTAQEFYERGIRHGNFEDPMMDTGWYGPAMEAYMNQEKPEDYVNVDPMGDGEDWPSVTKIGVKWNDGDDQETKLEKIITQKYLAVYPNSWVAWTDLRRTGYPKLFNVLNTSDGDGSIPQGGMIRRIPWQSTDPQVIKNLNATGIPALGGPDLQNTRLWWDVDVPNF